MPIRSLSAASRIKDVSEVLPEVGQGVATWRDARFGAAAAVKQQTLAAEFSIVVAVFNAERYLSDTLDSVL